MAKVTAYATITSIDGDEWVYVVDDPSGTPAGKKMLLSSFTKTADTDVSGASLVVDEDNMVSDLATKVPTQQSVKAYVDALDADDISDAATTNKFTTAADISKLAGIEALADVTDATNVDAAGATMNTDTDVSANSWVIDEDDMVSDLATKVPTQQSVKAYVDNNTSAPTQAQNDQTGTTYTLVLTDENKLVTMTNASASTLTVPPNSSVAFPDGARVDVVQRGAGQVTIAPGSGVTLRQPSDLSLAIAAQYGYVTLVKIGTDEWDVVGLLEPTGGNYVSAGTVPVEYSVACSDESTAITTTGTKATFRIPYAMTVTDVRASLTGACTTGTFTVDINDGGTTILSTKLTIDATEKTSTTAATAAVISDSALADDAEITIDVDNVGDSTATGLKVTLIGTADRS